MFLKSTLFTSIFVSVGMHMILALALHISPYIGKQVVPMGVNIVYVPQNKSDQEEPLQSLIEKDSSKNSNVKKIKLVQKKKKLDKKNKKKSSSLNKAFKYAQFGKKDGVRLDQEQKYLYQLREHIVKYLEYPRAAARLNQTGEVIVKVSIDRTGQIIHTEIEKSCPFMRLNEAAIKLVKSVGRFAPFPSVMSEDMVSVSIPVSYTLR